MAQKIKTLDEADRDTRAAINRTTKGIARLRKTLPKYTGRERKDVEATIKRYETAVTKLTQSSAGRLPPAPPAGCR